MKAHYTIEAAIPIPPRRDGYGAWKAIAAIMEVGDSVLTQNLTESRALKAALRRIYGSTCATYRTLDDGNGVRVWRTK